MKKYNQFLNELNKETWKRAVDKSNKMGFTDLSKRFKEHSDKLGEDLILQVVDIDGDVKEVNSKDLKLYYNGFPLYLNNFGEVKFPDRRESNKFIKFIKTELISVKNIKDLIYGYKPFMFIIKIKNDGTFLSWLEQNHPDKKTWDNIEKVFCSDNKLTTLKGIENLTNLQILTFSHNNRLTNLEGIENLTNLKYLDCPFNKLTSLNKIENLYNLKKLDCSYNELTSLEGIEKLTNLETLYCQGNLLTSLKGIEKLTNLKNLNCNDNKLTSLNEIENLTNLESLNCHSNSLTSLKGVENLTNLESLNISSLFIREIDLKKLTKLTRLISINNRQLVSIKGIENLKNLKILDIIDNNLDRTSRILIKKHCKKVDIIGDFSTKFFY